MLPETRPQRGYRTWIEVIERNEWAILIALALFCAVRLTLPAISSGLWTDESGTVWVILGGIKDLFHRATYFPQSFLYVLIAWASVRLGGLNEVALRVPSLLAFGLTLWLFYRLAKEMFGKRTAALALPVLLCVPGVVYIAVDARPYALGMLFVVLASMRARNLVQAWTFRNQLLYALPAALTAYFSYFYAFVIVAHFFYFSFARVSARAVVSTAFITGILITPLIPFVMATSKGAPLHMLGTVATPEAVATMFLPTVLGTFAIMIALLSAALRNTELAIRIPGSEMVLLLGWIAAPVLMLAGLAALTPFKMFALRYVLCTAPAAALIAARILESVKPTLLRLLSVAFICAVTLATTAPLRSIRFNHDFRGWREMIETARDYRATHPRVPIGLITGYIESTHIPLPASEFDNSWLLSILSMYPLSGPVSMLPYYTERNIPYLLSTAEEFDRAQTFVVILVEGEPLYIWLRGRFSTFEPHVLRSGSSGRLSIIEFKSPAASHSP